MIYAPLSWVRKIQKFSIAFILGNFLILLTVCVIFGFCFKFLYENGPGPGFVPINYSLFWNTVGFAVYSFEGIGVVMPIMSTCNCPEKFPKLLAGAIISLTVFYIIFAELCYYTWGNYLTEPIVT